MKIVALEINPDDDFSGVEAVALVNEPAIEHPFFAFKKEGQSVEDVIVTEIVKQELQKHEEFVTRSPGESEGDFIGRCIPALLLEGYPEDQAIAICYESLAAKKKRAKYASVIIDGKVAYDTIDQALLAAGEIGCEGYHEHEYEGDIYYMPCYTHDDVPTQEEFESYTDYPESATNAAKRALKWRDEHPDQGCGTRVGWARANQLANREPISEETIARMASFARHLQHEDVPYSEGCGGLMVDAWGGRAGIEWAQNKLEDIRQEQSKDLFSYFEDLPEGRQNDILEELKKIGKTTSQLSEQGYQIVSNYDTTSKLGFRVNKNDARPNQPTNDTTGPYKVLYRYGGPYDDKNRKFCRRLLDLDLLFRKEDIERLTIRGANEEFGVYDIFRYKGSYNCRHNWNRVLLYQTPGEVVTSNFGKESFATVGDQRMVVGPLMIPDKLILRVDKEGDPYFVYFSTDTVKNIAEKLMKSSLLHSMNLEHDPDRMVEGYMVETWIVNDSQKDKSATYGFNLPVGTWMGMYKIQDEEVWKMVKDGIVTGFSVEGFFADRFIQQ